MKIRNKMLIIIGLTSIFILAIGYFEAVRHPYLYFAGIIITFALLICLLLQTLITNRIEKLERMIVEIAQHRMRSESIEDIKGNDEVASIANNIHTLLLLNEATQRNLQKRIEERKQELNTATTYLQKEISQRTSAEKKLIDRKEYLTQIARYDTLTALPNRVVFNEILNKTINHAKRRQKILAILLIDIDTLKFKLDEEKNNHLLKELGKRFETVLRNEDILAKLDGNQFIVLLNDIAKAKFASTVAEKILGACQKPLVFNGGQFSFNASIGICIYPNDGDSLEILLNNVDLALYKAMHAGGNSYQFYTQEMDAEAHEYIKLESELRKALENHELCLYYQPKLNIKKGSVASVEALVRWEHPEFGIIPPSKFIPIAEETGLIKSIGQWILTEACKMNKHWQDEGYEHLSIAVNLSPKQFYDADIDKIITQILTETGLNAQYLELELAEKTVMDNAEAALSVLNKIKTTGVQLSLDHFGTGYTSISHLKQFPLSLIKIDPLFIKGAPNSPNDCAIISAVIALAHHLGLEVVAEGVETAEQVEFLAANQCDMIQGYFLSHPLPADKIVQQFKKLSDRVLL